MGSHIEIIWQHSTENPDKGLLNTQPRRKKSQAPTFEEAQLLLLLLYLEVVCFCFQFWELYKQIPKEGHPFTSKQPGVENDSPGILGWHHNVLDISSPKHPLYRAYFLGFPIGGPCWDRGPLSLPIPCFFQGPASFLSVQANYTTIMLRNIPNKYSRQMLIDQLLGFRKQRKRKETPGEVDEKK